jgi:uncharacterized protein
VGQIRAPPCHPVRDKEAGMESETRTWAMFGHLSALIGGMVGGVASFVGPLIIWLLRKDTDPFVAEHAKEALNFNIFVTLVVVVSIILSIATLGFGLLLAVPLWLVVGILWLVFTIQGAVRANGGQPYRYPITVRSQLALR